MKRGGGRYASTGGAVALVLSLVACTTVSAPPVPCDMLDDRPGLRQEILALKHLEGDPTKRLRWYALDADESCAGYRSLGAIRITATPQEPTWYRRAWAWIKEVFS